MVDLQKAKDKASSDWEKQTVDKWINKVNCELGSEKVTINDAAYMPSFKKE